MLNIIFEILCSVVLNVRVSFLFNLFGKNEKGVGCCFWYRHFDENPLSVKFKREEGSLRGPGVIFEPALST